MTNDHPDPRSPAIRSILKGFAALGGVLVFGVAGYMMLGWSFGDALYMVAITVSGVGFNEVREIRSVGLRAHTMMVIAFGVVATGYTVAGILRLVTEEELQRLVGHRRVKRQIEGMRDHTIVAGFGRMGSLICSELAAAGRPFVLVDRGPERLGEIEARGWLYLLGDATEEAVLREAGLERAGALVTAIPSDAVNVFITLTARDLAPKVQIIARAEHPSTQKKLIQAGADHVVLPASIGAHRIVSILTNPAALQFAELVTHRGRLEFEMDEMTIRPGGPFVGRTLREADIGRKTGVVVVAVKRADGQVDFPPSGDASLSAGDTLVLIGRRDNLAQFRGEFMGV